MDTPKVSDETLVDLMFHLKWKSDSARHTDVYNAAEVNVWRDYLPPAVLEAIKNRTVGERVDIQLKPEDLYPEVDKKKLIKILKRV